jgi:hypothetical protein
MGVPVPIDMIRMIDEIFIVMSEVAADPDLPINTAVEELWAEFELGELRLVIEGERLRIELFEGSARERLILAKRNRPIAAARRRALRV